MKTISCSILNLLLAFTAGAAVFDRPPGQGGGTVLVGNLTNSYVFGTGMSVSGGTNVNLNAALQTLSSNNGAGLTNLNVRHGRTLVVATNGNDAAAARDNIAVPFAAPAAATQAAQPGDTIHLGPGNFNAATNVSRADVNWHLDTGAILSATNWQRALIGDAGAALTNFIGGHGTLQAVYSDQATMRLGLVRLTNAGSFAHVQLRHLDYNGNSIIPGTNNNQGGPIFQSNGRLNIDAQSMRCC